ncbi:histone deacetylase, partial [candidate division GN15 bacterium]|nr:histone deacetylase [candidate division GN15 bacterium]
LTSDSPPVSLTAIELRSFGEEPIYAVHDRTFLDQLKSFAEHGGGQYDADTFVTETSYKAAVVVSDMLLSAIDTSFGGGPSMSIVIGRPPGHHAELSRSMGFCLINQAAIGAQYARDKHGADRVAIIDFDLHHGNGTQQIFYERDDVLYVSTHQYPYYPGTGAAGEIGEGAGEGFTRNFPLPAGTGHDAECDLFEREIIPELRRYDPDLLIVSAGFDGHQRDPLGMLTFTEHTYQTLGTRLADCAREVCDGRLVSFVEGGYDPQANRESIVAYLKGIQQL